MDKNIEKIINDIVWWIPFKSLRNAVREYLLYNINLNAELLKEIKNSNKNYKELNNKIDNLEEYIKKLNIKLPLYMSNDEKELFIKYIKNSKNYIEFGSGGSTFIVSKMTNANIISIEGDPNWIEYMRNNNTIFEAEQTSRLKFYYIDIGKVGYWSRPIDNSAEELYPNYSKYVFTKLNKDEINDIDTILIDGRFRVACALNSIFYCRNAKIIIHDFFNREYYNILLNYLDIIEKVDTLGVFKIKKDINFYEVEKLINEYAYDIR
ncbi:hypothetical protein R4M06_12415 [Brachyspira pilosicoli]|uniref:hypothetical protein n=1 Tax=Brachyspira pilosicoli TaxID=52584 RepID=UPI0030062E34